jgi:manganese-dependent inorganic pyrophosphatase
MSTTYIIGHQKPDTDSVVSAMALEFLYKQQDCFGHQQPQASPQAAIADPLNPETQYLFERFAVKAPSQISAKDIKAQDKVVLVDHNETSQRLPGLKQDQIVEIVDHHKAKLNLTRPIFLNFKAWGSSASIVYFMMKHYGPQPVKPSKKLASLMLAAILSDTVGFKSATTTEQDKQLAQELADIAQIKDLEQFTLDIFKAKSNFADLSDVELVKNDYKQYDFAQSVLIGQLETVEQSKILQERQAGLITALRQVKQETGVDLIFLAVSDVLKVNTKLLVADQASQQVAEQAFETQANNHLLDIGPKLSRKKQIAPAIEQTLQQG